MFVIPQGNAILGPYNMQNALWTKKISELF